MLDLHSQAAVNACMTELAGQRFRIEQNAERFMVIPLRGGDGGEIYLHGQQSVGAYIPTTYPNRTFDVIRDKCPLATISRLGQGEVIILHPISDGLEAFFRACWARTKRQISADERARLAQMSVDHSPLRERGPSMASQGDAKMA